MTIIGRLKTHIYGECLIGELDTGELVPVGEQEDNSVNWAESESYACIEENREHEIAELICLKCFNRAIHVYPEKTILKELECKCGEIGYLIKTGQTLPDFDVEKFEHDARYRNMVKMWGKKEAKEKYKTFVLGQE